MLRSLGRLFVLTSNLAIGVAAVTLSSPAGAQERVTLQVLATTDLHMYLKDYDYYGDRTDPGVGLVRVATMIREVRAKSPNTILVDNGDLIQGNPMGDWVARRQGVSLEQPHPVIEAMNLLGYDAASLGNHEFNYGLDFLRQTYAGAKFPVLSANVHELDGDSDPANDPTLYPPYVILDRELTDSRGGRHKVRIGLVGFLPPQIMTWDKDKLEGRVTARDVVEAAHRYVPEIIEKGADVVVAISHGGLTASPRAGGEENASAYLTTIPGVDAVVTGHSHRIFPGPDYTGFPNADLDKGTLNGKPLVMSGNFGSHLGVIELTLEKTGAEWKVVDGRAEARPILTHREGKPVTVLPDPELEALLAQAHEGTLSYVRTAVGKTTRPIHTYFAFLGDNPAVELVAEAQRAFMAKVLKGTEFEKLPILSAAAPFKSGGRPGVDYYTDIPAGEIAVRNVADLYIYPNQVAGVRLTGAQVREWLEMASRIFNRIDPTSKEPQPLVDRRVPSYVFDVIDGVTYAIDLTQPLRYDSDGKLVNPQARRIVDLRFQGKPIDDTQSFIVVTNNYRANGGGGFPGLDRSTVVHLDQSTVPEVILDYIREKGVIEPAHDGSWRFQPIDAPVDLLYETTPKARDFLAEQPNLTYLGPGENGFDLYKVDLSRKSGKAR